VLEPGSFCQNSLAQLFGSCSNLAAVGGDFIVAVGEFGAIDSKIMMVVIAEALVDARVQFMVFNFDWGLGYFNYWNWVDKHELKGFLKFTLQNPR
jgi:hypothetical protein